MCFPILIGAIGTAVSMAGAIQQGQAAKAQADAQAKAYQQQADQQLRQGQFDADRIKEQGEGVLGRQTALVGGSGVDAASDSVANVIGSTASNINLDYSSRLYGAKVASDNDRYQARLASIAGKNAQTGSYFNAAGQLFGGLGQIGKMWDPKKTTLGNAFSMGA